MKTESENPKPVPEMNGFKPGNSVKVKCGTVDPDDGKTQIGGWVGRIKEICDDGLAEIEWDSITIRAMNIKQIKKYEKQGFEWNKMLLALQEIEKCDPRDKEDDASEETSKIQWRYFRKEYFP